MAVTTTASIQFPSFKFILSKKSSTITTTTSFPCILCGPSEKRKKKTFFYLEADSFVVWTHQAIIFFFARSLLFIRLVRFVFFVLWNYYRDWIREKKKGRKKRRKSWSISIHLCSLIQVYFLLAESQNMTLLLPLTIRTAGGEKKSNRVSSGLSVSRQQVKLKVERGQLWSKTEKQIKCQDLFLS